ncbi:NAD(P)/FAD-dependent oxidoreductase [Nocardia sp. alder85J]|uniref:NAD(P)/FAD-dependent oxidoreductase n=1 Tax=Nocardia sp. alder85J TaxID=2862949 RepID=UPI001CD6F1D6|nr:NAD(P)/FAD-dependent oxidoreductase [Nocardia sp. alder85J]MCX4090844.1 NAD(P)/FAD-dependent oxidoreductase [Nocardia sp. alder85J]
MTNDSCDAVVIGGGAAGLNGALMLARSRRSVLVIDAGAPRNAPAGAVRGLFARDGVSPAELTGRGRDEVRHYGGELTTGEVTTVTGAIGEFTVHLADGRTVRARRLLVATGLVDELPGVPGLRERWGRDVVHCPYCHGWEHRDEAIGVLASGPIAMHAALLWRQLSADVVVFTGDGDAPDDPERLAALGIRVVPGAVAAAEITGDRLTGVRLADGTLVSRDALAVPTRMVARTAFLADLGLHPVPHPSGMGEHLPADPFGRSDVPGVWLAGNVTDLSAQVGNAAAAGATAGAHINADLVTEDADRAVAEYRARAAAPARATTAAGAPGRSPR